MKKDNVEIRIGTIAESENDGNSGEKNDVSPKSEKVKKTSEKTVKDTDGKSEINKDKKQVNDGITNTFPLIPLRGKVLFPSTVLNFDVGRPMSVSAVEAGAENDSLVFISAQKNAFIDAPVKKDLCQVGVVAKIKQIVRIPSGAMKLSVEAVYRAKIVSFVPEKSYFRVMAEEFPYLKGDPMETEASYRLAKNAFYEYTLFDKRLTKETLLALTSVTDPDAFMDNALSVVSFKEEDCIEILSCENTLDRLTLFRKLFEKETEIAKLEKKISAKVRQSIDKSQKEYYLREQLKAIHEELGDEEDEQSELLKKIKEKRLPQEVDEKARKEVSRLDKVNASSPEYSIILNYLDWIFDLPFSESTEDEKDLNKAKEILDGDHFGLQKVKQRIVEYLAVLKLTKKIKGPILCFVGPPGVGKTSVAKSIARALNRKFVRMSLGGVRDEAEIRGHRRTYVGAMPGRIIYGMKSAGSINPVFLLDEIDKMSSDIHGDPASALLEVLDPEQNSSFRDRYMEIPYDLSKVMFITTANTVETIPAPLLDRMEIIELTGYTDEEKTEIAKRYLVPKQLEQNGLTAERLSITDGAIVKVIEDYTMEAGVRNLEREIGGLIRKVATKFAEDPQTPPQAIDSSDVSSYLGTKRHLRDIVMDKDEVGATTGLAWTSVGGTTLTIEVCLYKGKGDIILTGKLGDVMKESARTALSYIRSRAKEFNIDEADFEKKDVHIHVPEGATPKDGPSAGITMATAILSAFIGKPVTREIAMTGEITLRGKVLPIGGLKEKALAGYRNGIKKIIIPKENERDLSDIPEEIRNKIEFIPCENADEVFVRAIKF